MNWIDQKYISLISVRLQRFTNRNGSFNFRCPICGDSQKSKTKSRGWIYVKDNKAKFFCHNCNAAMSLGNFIKTLDDSLYSDYKFERFKETGFKTSKFEEIESFTSKLKTPDFVADTAFKKAIKVSSLSEDHPVKKYIVKRRIPFAQHFKLFYVKEFYAFVNEFIPDKFNEKALEHDEARLVIPFFDENKKLFGFQGRVLGGNSTKYITIMLDESKRKLYGLDTVDLRETTYVFEGPIDAMFIPNSIATAGSDLVLGVRGLNTENMVVVYDNERRSVHTVKKIESAIDSGFKVCIWPDSIVQKDINDMVLAGMKPDYLKALIDENTFSGLRANMEFNSWKRVKSFTNYSHRGNNASRNYRSSN